MNNTHSVSEKSFYRYGSISLDLELVSESVKEPDSPIRKFHRRRALELALMVLLAVLSAAAATAFAISKFLGF